MKHIFTAICLACFFLANPPAIPASSTGYVLSLHDKNGRRLYAVPVQNGDGFAIRYTHSVALTPVTDFFIIKDGKIYLDKTIYKDFGAGLPHEPEGAQQMKAEHGQVSITGFNREIPELCMRVGRVANHTLLLPGIKGGGDSSTGEVPLASLSPPGSVIIFRVLQEEK